jgi:hypothetical protein
MAGLTDRENAVGLPVRAQIGKIERCIRSNPKVGPLSGRPSPHAKKILKIF